ncbi:shikimate dehydrogenase [Murinocardiopsis flavida]|uniref:Shikimate dehydrogenase (NADP(+)) n=1 Tax=Murinocardiopsis flavida TaxID=645275 RepID=A0A2P8DUI0_9ACTN|nr:shikimate dehydrogenase [Murinocardiopsis flavida]PSL00887.1 shikimate dehydrogenase [Murinocardiopsis flavida]
MPPDRRSYLVGLIGAGVGPSLTPELHEREADRHGLRYVYRTIDVAAAGRGPDDIGALIGAAARLGFDGLNITHPCKRTAPRHLDRLSAEASLLGAVNTVLFTGGQAVGHNTDWSGFAHSFTRGLPGAPLGTVVLMGAGGAGAAVAYALLGLGAEHIAVVDAEPARARGLAAALRAHPGGDRVAGADRGALPGLLARADGLVNTTPVGMAAEPGTPVPPGLLDPRTWVADVVYRPALTPLLDHAAALGCRTLGGTGMAVFQAADAFRLITGAEPDTERMLDDMAALLAPSTTP